jgi:outer membrane protein TolC
LYFRALAAEELVRDAALSVERRSQQQEAIEELAKGGLRPGVDAVRASVDVVAARYLFEMRTIEQQAAFAALSYAMGSRPDSGTRPAELSQGRPTNSIGLPGAVTLAEKRHPELHRRRSVLEAAHERYEEAGARRWPTMGVFAFGQTSYFSVLQGQGIQGDQYLTQGGVFVRWEGANPSVRRNVGVASARVLEARRALETAVLDVQKEAADAWYAERRARAGLEQAERVSEVAGTTRTAQLERYRQGVASLLELLDAEALEQAGRRARIEARRDYDIACVRVLAAIGELDRLSQ